MASTIETNKELMEKYHLDNTILKSYFKNERNQTLDGTTFPLRIDNRQYCSPTDYQGKNPSCCGYSAAQILESLHWMEYGKIIQFDANQIYAKAKEEDKQVGNGGTYPDLAMSKGLELLGDFGKKFKVETSKTSNVNDLKRILHKNMFACANMKVTTDLYTLSPSNFIYNENNGKIAGGHSLVCCGYDEDAKMLIMQNHWGIGWGLKGFFLCPYDVWAKQTGLTCWFERKK